jgi:hypothetical protein
LKHLFSVAVAAAALATATAGRADTVYNTELGSLPSPGSTVTDATGTRSTNPVDGAPNRVNEAFGGFYSWQQRDVGGGAVVGITTDYARSGNGSAFFSTEDGNSKASLELFFEGPVALSEFNGASYDWYRDSASTNPGAQAPSLRLYVLDGVTGGTLIFEPYYQGPPVDVATDSWQTSTIDFNSTVWARPVFGAPPGASCDPDACFATLGAYAGAHPGLLVTGFSTGVGSGWNGAFKGAVDNITFSFGGGESTYNFEVTSVPEPATWAMMLMGFGGLGAVIRRRRAALAA